MKLPYKVMSSAALSVVVASIPVIVHAQAGDFYNQTKQLKYSQSDLRSNATLANKLQDEMDNGDTIIKEVTTGQYLDYVKANDAFINIIANGGDTNTALTEAITAGATSATSDELNGYTPATPDEETLAVSSVSAITATTADVTLVDVQATSPTVDKFNVLVNGTKVTATNVALKAGTTKTYTLTFPTLTNQEGSFTVNGIAPVTKVASGSDFDIDFKTPTAALKVVDSNTIDITFSEKLTKANAETVGTNYVVRKISNAADDAAPSSAVLQADGKTIRLTLSTALNPANYVLKLNTVAGATAISDLAGNYLSTGTEVAFTGTADADTTKPTVVSSSYDPASGIVYVNFSEKMDNNTFVKSGFSITDGTSTVTLGVNETGAWNGTRTQLAITLSNTDKVAVNALGTTKTLSITADSVKDAALNGVAAVSNVAVSARTVLSTASYDQSTNLLTLTFSNPVDVSTLVLGEFTLDGTSTRTLLATDVVKTTDDGKTVDIEVKKNPELDTYEGTGVTNRNVDFTAASGNFVDANGVAIVATSNIALTYTADTTAPTVTSATYNKTTNRLTLVFSEPVQIDDAADAYQPVAANIAFTAGANLLTDVECEQYTTDSAATSASTVTFVDAGSTLDDTSKIYFPTEGAFKDDAGNKLAVVGQSAAIPVTYVDQTGPTATAAAALTSTSATLTYNKKVDRATAENIANYKVTMTTNPNVAIPVTSAMLDGSGTVVTLVFGSATTQGIGYTITANNIVDTYNNPIQTTAGANAQAFNGSIATDTTGPSLAGVAPKFVDNDDSKSITAGDQLVYTFDEPLNIDFSKITTADYAITGGKSFGQSPVIGYGDAKNQIKVTLGASPTVTWADTLTPVASSDFKDLAGNSAQAVASGALANPGTAPKIKTITYADTNASGDVNAGDKLTITYDRNLSLPNGAAALSAADFTPDGGLAFGATPTFELANGNQIIVTLGGAGIAVDASAATDDTIDEAASVNIADEWGKTQLVADTTTATVTSADRTSPTITSVALTKGTGNSAATLEVNDKITITLSEAVSKPAFAATDFVLYKGATAVVYGGTTGDVAVSGNIITITVKGIDGGAGDDGWVGETISSLSTFNFDGAVTSISDASGNIASPSAGFGVTITK